MLRCRVVGPLLQVSHKEAQKPQASDTKPVRSSEQLDWDALNRYVRPRLGGQLGDDATGPMTEHRVIDVGVGPNIIQQLLFGN